MLALANVLHFFPNEFAGLSGWRQTLPFVFARSFDCVLFWHHEIGSLLVLHPDVIQTREANRSNVSQRGSSGLAGLI
jgi:hypothetical protein